MGVVSATVLHLLFHVMNLTNVFSKGINSVILFLCFFIG